MSSIFPIAVIADVHANVWALEAVLRDIKNRGIETIINLGDSVYGPLAPYESAEMLLSEQIIHIQGNEDRIIYEPSYTSPTIAFTRNQLHERHIEWLRFLPNAQVFAENIFLCHGTPQSDETYLLEDPTTGGGKILPDAQITERLGVVTQSLVLCAHSHTARTVQLLDGRLIVNPGSVGLSAYQDEEPFPHKMETGSPHARYAIISWDKSTYSVNHLALKYAWDKAAATARANGREDWARWLESGRA